MPVIPEFQPASAPGSILQNSQSLMQRASANRRAEEAADMERQKFEIMRPVLESQARVQLVSEANDLTAAHIVNNSIASDLQRFPDYVKQWTESATIEDPKERLNERRRIIGAITPFAAIKSTSEMVKRFQEQYAQDAITDKTADSLANKLDVTGAQNDAKLAKADKDLEAKRLTLEARQREFDLKQDHAKQMEDIKASNAKDLETLRGENRMATTKAAGEVKQGTAKEAAANKINDVVLQEAQTASNELRDYNQALTLLRDPATRTGTGAQFEASARKIGGIFGLDTGNAKNIEQLQSLLGTSFLEKAKSLKGNFSDRDAQTIQRITPGIATTNEGNIALLTMLIQKRQRDLEIGSLINESRKQGESERGIQQDVFDYIQAHPLTGPAGDTPSGFTPDKEKRLQELRAKLGK